MPSLHMPAVSLLFAAAFGLLNLWLGLRTSQARTARKVMLGDGGDPLVTARMRAHANFVDYVPMALVLMTLIELTAGGRNALWVIGSLLAAGRVVHPFGMERPAPNPLRLGGIMLTWGASAALVAWAVWLLVHPPAGVRYF